MKSQAITNLLAQFSREKEFPLNDKVPGEMATVELTEEQWILKFNGSFTTNSRGAGVVLYHEGEETVALSFKLEFPCSNNTAEYEAYLTGSAIALEMGIKHLKVIGNSNLVVYQAKGSFSLKEPSMAPYRMLAQHTQRSENRYTGALASLGSQIAFKMSSIRVEVNK